MKKLALAVVLTLAATSAQASLFCRNDIGQTLEWKWGHPRPATGVGTFDIRPPREITCIVNGFALANGVYKSGLPSLAVTSPDSTAGSPGLIYRGAEARWLIDNLPAASGQPATLADYAGTTP